MTDFAALAGPIEDAFRATRARIMAAYQAPPDPERFKDDGSSVTDLDLALETELGDTLLSLEATYGVYGEESGMLREGSPTWHLDPLDGTANFARRIALFGSQIVLMDGIKPLFAAIYEPLLDRFTWAARGAGTWHEGRRIRLPDRPPKHAVLYTDIARSGLFEERPRLIMELRRSSYKARALGSIAIHLRDVAIGAADGYLGGRRYVTPFHDLGPGTLLLREAGGLVTDAEGEDALVERRVVLAGGPQVHRWLRDLVAS